MRHALFLALLRCGCAALASGAVAAALLALLSALRLPAVFWAALADNIILLAIKVHKMLRNGQAQLHLFLSCKEGSLNGVIDALCNGALIEGKDVSIYFVILLLWWL